MKHSLKSDIIGMVLLLFFLLSLKAETARNPLIVAVRPACNVMPENITDIVLKVIIAIRVITSCQIKHSRSYLFSQDTPFR